MNAPPPCLWQFDFVQRRRSQRRRMKDNCYEDDEQRETDTSKETLEDDECGAGGK